MRVAKSVFFTIPNRWVPIEHHTGIALLHYSPALFRRLVANGDKAYWADQENVDFLCKSTVRQEFKHYLNLRLKYAGLLLRAVQLECGHNLQGHPLGRLNSIVACSRRRFQPRLVCDGIGQFPKPRSG